MPAVGSSPPFGLLRGGPLLTITEVARELDWSPFTVKRLIRAGVIPSVRFPGRRPYFVRLDDLRRYVGGKEVAP